MKKGNIQKKVLANESIEKSKQKIVQIKSKKVLDYEKYFEDINLDDFEISNESLKMDLDKFVPKPVVRTFEELKAEAGKRMIEALSGIKFGFVERDDFFLDDSVDVEPFSGEVDKNTIKKCLFEFAFICGNYNKNRKWIRYDEGLYFCLPLLYEKGNHATLVTFFAEKIAKKLETGMKNAITNVLEKKNMEIVQPRYCFSKGHLVVVEENRVKVLNDLRIIFTQMGKQQNDRDFSGISFLAKVKK